MRIWLLLLLPTALLAGLALSSEEPASSAEPATALPTEFQYIPADAAFFIHADSAQLWNGTLGKTLRNADATSFDELTTNAKKMFGATPDALKSIAIFWPKVTGQQDIAAMGVVLAFNAPFDKAQLKAGFEKMLPKGTKVALETPSDRIVVLLAGLDPQIYGKPQPANRAGPLTATIREAASGKHLLVVGATLANFPDEIRGDSLPEFFRAFQPLFNAESIAGILDLDKDLTVEIRVKSSTPPRAKEAEKTLGFLANLIQEALTSEIKELGSDGDKDPAIKDILTILTRLQGGVKDAKFSTEGEVTRLTAKVSADLPIASAFLSAKRMVQESAARSQSSNNLKQIALAFYNYGSANNDLFPPAAVCDKTGKPMLSWRVLILPFIEEDALYKQFKLDEPWDSENNKKLIAKMPKTYALPTPTTAKANETHYRVFTGNGAAFDYLKGPRPVDFEDGTSNTLLVVTAKDAVIWTKPYELDFDPDKDMTKLLGFFAGDSCLVALGDGSIRGVKKKISKVTLHGAITRSGGEVLGDDF